MAIHSPTHAIRSTPRGSIVKMKELHCNVEHMNAINNNTSPVALRKQVQLFSDWYKNIVDESRSTLGLYLSDDCVFQWFGRTMTTKKNIIGFINYDMIFNYHVFTNVKPCGPISLNDGRPQVSTFSLNKSNPYEDLATPLDDCPLEILKRLNQPSLMRKSASPIKRSRTAPPSPESKSDKHILHKKSRKIQSVNKECQNNNTIVEFKYNLRSGARRAENHVLPCLQKTPENNKSAIIKRASGSPTKNELSEPSHVYMEATCILQFTKTRNKRGANVYSWERQCKLQVEFSSNPDCVGEYIIWTIMYSDNNKCRRNLLAAFDAVGD